MRWVYDEVVTCACGSVFGFVLFLGEGFMLFWVSLCEWVLRGIVIIV